MELILKCNSFINPMVHMYLNEAEEVVCSDGLSSAVSLKCLS